MTTSSRTTALIYVRVSRLDREDRDRLRAEGDDAKLRALSPGTQLAQVKALPALRGLTVEHFEDLDIGGGTTQRPAYQAMLERLRAGDVAVVAAYSLSRISRSVSDFYRLYEEVLKPAGVAFVSATESIDSSTPQGRAFMGMSAVWAQMEREVTSERVRDNVEHAARTGKLVGMLPFGYKRVDGRVAIDEDEAAVVRLIFTKYASGTMSYRDLARWLNAEGIRPPSFGLGRKNDRADWVMDAVREILAREVYVGRFVHGRGRRTTRRALAQGPTIKGDYPAIIDEATWDACVALRRKNGTHRMTVGATRVARYALTGLARCDRCGGTVHGVTTGSAQRPQAYYSCRRRLGARSCEAPFVRSELLEDEVRAWLAAVRVPAGFEEAFAGALGADPTTPRRTSRADRRRELERRLERLADMYELGHLERDAYLAKRSEIEAALAEVEERQEDPRSVLVLSKRIASIVDDWDRMDAGQRRRVLATMFDELVVDGQLVAATPKAGWLEYLEAATSTKGRAVSCVTSGQRGNRTPTARGG